MPEHADPEVPQELLPHPAHQHDLSPPQHQGQQGDAEVGEGRPVQGRRAAVLAQAVVDAVADDAGAGDGRQREQHHHSQGEDNQGPVGPQHAERAADDPARLLPAEPVLLVQRHVAPPAHG